MKFGKRMRCLWASGTFHIEKSTYRSGCLNAGINLTLHQSAKDHASGKVLIRGRRCPVDWLAICKATWASLGKSGNLGAVATFASNYRDYRRLSKCAFLKDVKTSPDAFFCHNKSKQSPSFVRRMPLSITNVCSQSRCL